MRTSYSSIVHLTQAELTERQAAGTLPPAGITIHIVDNTGVFVEEKKSAGASSQPVSGGGGVGGSGSVPTNWVANTALDAGKIILATVAIGGFAVGEQIYSTTAITTGATFNTTEAARFISVPEDTTIVKTTSLTDGSMNAYFESIKVDGVINLTASSDLDTLTETGVFNVATPINAPVTIANAWWYVEHYRHRNTTTVDGNYAFQRAIRLNGTDNTWYYRVRNSGTWTAWATSASQDFVNTLFNLSDSKYSVKVATTTDITLSATQTIDGVAVAVGDRVLVKNQTTASANGIYVVAAGAWTRATDADGAGELSSGGLVYVEEGTTQTKTHWVLTNTGTITLGTTGLTFEKLSFEPKAKKVTVHIVNTDVAIKEVDNTTEYHFEGTAKATILATDITSDQFGFTLTNTDAGVDRTIVPTGFAGVFLRSGGTNSNLGNVAFTVKDNESYTCTVTINAGSRYLNIRSLNTPTATGAGETVTVGTQITATTSLVVADWSKHFPVDASAGNVAVILPTAVGNTGKSIRVIRLDSSVNTVTVYSATGEIFSGLQTGAIAIGLKSAGMLVLQSNGTSPVVADVVGLASVSRAWVPTDLAGLAVQYSADSLSAFASGAQIDTWADTSGNSRDATQATAGARPTRHATQLNGFNVASFDGTDDRIATIAFPATDWGTTDHVVLSVANIAVSGRDVVGAGNAADGAFLIGNYVGNKMRAHAWRGATANTIDGATALTLSTWHIVGERLSGANLAVRLDGEQDATITMSGTSGTGAPTEFVLGSRASTVTSPIFSGQMAETLVFLATVADADLAKADAYLAHKYGLVANLGAGHAYKVSPPVTSLATY